MYTFKITFWKIHDEFENLYLFDVLYQQRNEFGQAGTGCFSLHFAAFKEIFLEIHNKFSLRLRIKNFNPL